MQVCIQLTLRRARLLFADLTSPIPISGANVSPPAKLSEKWLRALFMDCSKQKLWKRSITMNKALRFVWLLSIYLILSSCYFPRVRSQPESRLERGEGVGRSLEPVAYHARSDLVCRLLAIACQSTTNCNYTWT